MVSGLGIPVIVPSSDSTFRHPLPSPGSLRFGSPASSVLPGAPTPDRPSRRTSFPSFDGTPLAFEPSLPVTANARSLGLGLFYGFPAPFLSRGDDRASQVPGKPSVSMPCSPTPVGPSCQAHTACWCGLPPHLQRRLPRKAPFGAQSHGLLTRCLRFAAVVTHGI